MCHRIEVARKYCVPVVVRAAGADFDVARAAEVRTVQIRVGQVGYLSPEDFIHAKILTP